MVGQEYLLEILVKFFQAKLKYMVMSFSYEIIRKGYITHERIVGLNLYFEG